jgi:hypothetical protein
MDLISLMGFSSGPGEVGACEEMTTCVDMISVERTSR